MRFIAPFVLAFAAATASADERVPLAQDAALQSGLRDLAQGYFMRKNCDQISMRLFRALGLVNSLKARGRALGYSKEEIEAYLEDADEKARVEASARADLTSIGVDFDDPSTYCVVARQQIALNQRFGPYFRAK